MNPIRMGSLAVYGKAGCHSLASPVLHGHHPGRTAHHNGRPCPHQSSIVRKNYGKVAATKNGSVWSIPYNARAKPLTGRLVGPA